jgi:MFS superfamily sulfate permease-like transporter
MKLAVTIFPFLKWFRNYHLLHFRADLIAGLTVALVLIPQSMAYAQLAGLPSYYGLYAALLPPAIAALFGSSRQLATGPVAVVSVMTAVALEPLATAGSNEYISYAILMALIVGLFQLSLGILKLGLLVNLLSHPVVNGFSNAAAIFIATSQLSKIFGIEIDKGEFHYQTVFRVCVAAYQHLHWPTFMMALLAFVIMYGLAKLSSKIPYILIAVALTTVLSWAIGFERYQVVDADQIVSAQVKETLESFNCNKMQESGLLAKRSQLNQDLTAAMTAADEVAAINIRRDIALNAYEISQNLTRAVILRNAIRDFKLHADDISGQLRRYHLEGQNPVDSKSDGRIWHIAVDNRSLNMKALQLVGGGQVVGAIPRGLPTFGISDIKLDIVKKLIPYCITIALLGFMEAISVAKAMAARTGQRVDPDQELIGQGLANISGSFAQSFPSAGSFSRSAVNLQVGAFSGLSSVIASLTVLVTLFLFTPLLYHLPQSVLAAIIMMAVIGLINIKGFVHAWKAQWYDGTISIIVFIATLVFAPHLERGIFLGVVLSLSVFIYKNMRPNVVDLSLGKDFALHDAVSFGLQECLFIDVVRFDGPLFFANASYLEDQIRLRRRNKKQLKHIIVAAEGINDVDASGQEALSLIVDRVRSANIDISLSGVHENVRKVLERTHLLEKIGEDHMFTSINKAINVIHKQTHRGEKEKQCPLVSVRTLQDR